MRIALLCRGSNVTARVDVVNRASHALPAGKVTDAAKDVTGDFHNWTPVEVIISVKRSISPTTSRKNPFLTKYSSFVINLKKMNKYTKIGI